VWAGWCKQIAGPLRGKTCDRRIFNVGTSEQCMHSVGKMTMHSLALGAKEGCGSLQDMQYDECRPKGPLQKPAIAEKLWTHSYSHA